MPLFSLTDITFSGSSRNRDTTTSQLSGTAYKYNILRYPSDLGNYDKGHYILLHINEQKLTQVGNVNESVEKTSSEAINEARRQYVGSTTTGEVINNLYTGVKEVGDKFTSEVSNFLGLKQIGEALDSFGSPNSSGIADGVISKTPGLLNGLSSLGQQALSGQGLRTTRRTTDTVALYMPDTLTFTDNQRYGELEMGGTVASGAMSAIAGGIETYRAGGDVNAIGRNLSPFVYNAITQNSLVTGALGQNISTFLFAASGLAKNPMMEVLYTSPQLRTFRFDFMFYPRSEAEAKEVYEIIERIRFHQAPEYLKNSGGFYLIPPSEFDIKFMYNGQENPNIPKILGSCVLESVDLDFAPNGFAAYESVGQNSPTKGGTGTPVATRLSLSFKETTIVTKQDFETGQNRASNVGGA